MKISHVLSFSFVLMTTQVWAARPTATPNAETRFIQRAMALQGMNLSQTELQQRANDALIAYDKAAPFDGREERMASTLVAMQAMTPAQVSDLKTRIDANTLMALSTATNMQSALAMTLQTTFAHANQGAEFSSCQQGLEWGAGFAVGSAALFGYGYYVKEYGSSPDMGDNQAFENALETIGSYLGGAVLGVASIIMFATAGC